MSAVEDVLESLSEDDSVAVLLKSIPPIELLRIAPMPEVVRLSSLSEDSWNREHPDKIVRLSRRRNGVRVVDALLLRKPA